MSIESAETPSDFLFPFRRFFQTSFLVEAGGVIPSLSWHSYNNAWQIQPLLFYYLVLTLPKINGYHYVSVYLSDNFYCSGNIIKGKQVPHRHMKESGYFTLLPECEEQVSTFFWSGGLARHCSQPLFHVFVADLFCDVC